MGSQVKPDGVTVTEEEYLKLLDMSDRDHTLESAYLARHVKLYNVPGNQWAFKLLLEWRTNASQG